MEIGAVLKERALQGRSELLIPSGRRVVLLRRCTSGQDELMATDDEELLGARCLPELGDRRDSGDAEA